MCLLEGREIKNARKKAGFTQIELAKKLGMSFGPINTVENGWESISLSNLRKICKEIGLEVLIRPVKNG